jgi:hypothetical protein
MHMPDDWLQVAPTVPKRYVGLWKRASYVDENYRDETTLRYWLQTPHWHADLGRSADRPAFEGVSSLMQCSAMQLDWLCRGQAFAGPTRISGDLCYWDRQWDFQLRDTPDIGRMSFTSNSLIEDGVFGAYREVWLKQAGDAVDERALQGHRPGDPQILLLATGGHFMYMRERELRAAPACRARRQCAAGTASRSEQEAFADFDMSFGRYNDAGWVIESSTLPWREGDCIPCDTHGVPDIARMSDGRGSAWRQLEPVSIYDIPATTNRITK